MEVSERTAYIQSLFRKIHENPDPSDDPLNDVEAFLPEYISVLYEARSAQLATEDLKNASSGLANWESFFATFSSAHRSQILVGLGWSIAETEAYQTFDFSPFNSSELWRIADGCGYYAGLFKRRAAVRQQIYPEALPGEFKRGFDQGLGRSFWYILQGEAERIRDLVAHFSPERHRDLWRGVGVAMTYVGGIEKKQLDELILCTNSSLPSLKIGALLALDGRSKTGVETESDLLIKQHLQLPDQVNFSASASFSETLENLEKQLLSSES